MGSDHHLVLLLGNLVYSGRAPEVILALLRKLHVILRLLGAPALRHHHWRVLVLLRLLNDLV